MDEMSSLEKKKFLEESICIRNFAKRIGSENLSRDKETDFSYSMLLSDVISSS